MYFPNLLVVTLRYLHFSRYCDRVHSRYVKFLVNPTPRFKMYSPLSFLCNQRSLARQSAPSVYPRKTSISDVKHRILESIMDRHISISHFLIHTLILIKHPTQISLASPTGQIRVVDRWRNAHADCSLAVKVA